MRMCHRPGLQRCGKYPGRRKTNLSDIFERSHGKGGRSKDPAGSCEREKTKEKEDCIKAVKYRREPVGTLGIACCTTEGCFCLDRKKEG